MSTTSAYFIPKTPFAIGQFENTVKSSLERLGIIDGYYDAESKLYACSSNLPFEYASITDSENLRLIPEASSEGYGAVCKYCHKDIDEVLYDAINNFYNLESDSAEKKGMDSILVVCPNCSTSQKLGNLTFTSNAHLANQYFQFVDIDSEISSTVLEQLEASIGSDLDIIYEHM